MAKSIKKFASKGFFQTVDLDLLERLLERHAAGLPFAPSDLPEDEKERRRALHDHFLVIDEGFPDELLDALHCILQLSDKQGLSCLCERAALTGVQLVPVAETEGDRDGRHLHPQHVALTFWFVGVHRSPLQLAAVGDARCADEMTWRRWPNCRRAWRR
jgi:hypothetical protein